MKLAGPGKRRAMPLSSVSPVLGLFMLANACNSASLSLFSIPYSVTCLTQQPAITTVLAVDE